MGFHVNVNSILRSAVSQPLEIGAVLPFEKAGSRIFFDNIPVWLTDERWTALAEISIVSQTRSKGKLSGEYRVDYVYSGAEQETISRMFVRMYDGLMDDYIYVLSSQSEYQSALEQGSLQRASLNSEGFIHASPRSQLNRIANKYYREVANPRILVVDKKKIIPPVEWEPATGGLYPHIYGPLNADAICRVQAIALNERGDFAIAFGE